MLPGVFIMEKAASVTVTMGAALYFDESEEKITTVAAGKCPCRLCRRRRGGK